MVDPRKGPMQYTHLSASERRDMPLTDNPNTTPFQSHQSLGQALGPPQHMYSRPPDNYHPIPTQSPPTQQLAYSVPAQIAGPSAPKRKPPQQQPDGLLNGPLSKRQRPADDSGSVAGPSTAAAAATPTEYDDSSGAGAKHWSDDEKTLLFQWLMGPTNDDHWNSLRATKNSCLRECAVEVFGNKKTYQALKGCYERNFNIFKQIYVFENYHQQAGTGPHPTSPSETDRIREYERRLTLAKRAGCEVGNISARVIDHWHRIGWYDLFHRRYDGELAEAAAENAQGRWHGDPAAAMRMRGQQQHHHHHNMPDDNDVDDDQTLDYDSPHPMNTHPPPPPIPPQTPLHHNPHLTFISPHQTLRESQTPQASSTAPTGHSPSPIAPPMQTPIPPAIVPLAASSGSSEPTVVNVSLTQGMISAYMQFLQMQTQTGKQKLEFLRRRDEREEKESSSRRETEKSRAEREKAEFEHNKQIALLKARGDRAVEVLNSPMMDPALKQAAAEYLRKTFE
ncbi:hypothetical protein HMN09_00436000 [Mycena chlorophos]|uniref:Uncharacterized protein n=1 Tax=Mycena chlorophos TaxID=658473 RepID=A0A8H6TGR1_MYCCL|nr:hypothetical protein HMN09_00436000 [Mycena chlorophos]